MSLMSLPSGCAPLLGILGLLGVAIIAVSRLV